MRNTALDKYLSARLKGLILIVSVGCCFVGCGAHNPLDLHAPTRLHRIRLSGSLPVLAPRLTGGDRARNRCPLKHRFPAIQEPDFENSPPHRFCCNCICTECVLLLCRRCSTNPRIHQLHLLIITPRPLHVSSRERLLE